MAKFSIPIQVNGLEVLRKFMYDHEVVRLPNESEEHHAGYLECWQHIRNVLDIWRNKTDVTDEALAAVAQFLVVSGTEYYFMYKGGKYRMTIAEVEKDG